MADVATLFLCERQRARLTVGACARLWLSANDAERKPHPWEGRHACITCPIGAANAGRPMSPVAAEVMALRTICPRCLCPSDRIIKDLLCISCYNRDAEARRRRNAKGGLPRLCAMLHSVNVVKQAAGALDIISVELALSAGEVIVHQARHAESTLSFGWVAAGPGNIEGIDHE